MLTVTLQPANLPSGEYDVNQPLPYPYHVEVATGMVQRQEFWKGDPFILIGFQDDADDQTIDLTWKSFSEGKGNPIGKFPVFITKDGGMYNMTTPITKMYFSGKSELTFTDEIKAHEAQKSLEGFGLTTSLVGYDPSREKYAFDAGRE